MGGFDLNKDGNKQRRNGDSWHCLDSHKHGRSKRYSRFNSLSSIFSLILNLYLKSINGFLRLSLDVSCTPMFA